MEIIVKFNYIIANKSFKDIFKEYFYKNISICEACEI